MVNKDRSKATSTSVRLSELQLAVMNVLWRGGEATTAEVHEQVGKARSLAYTTVSTLLTRLEGRGAVRSVKRRRERVFEPFVSESEVRRSMVSELVENLFAGDAHALVSHLIRESDIGAGDIEAVRTLLEKHSGERSGEGQ